MLQPWGERNKGTRVARGGQGAKTSKNRKVTRTERRSAYLLRLAGALRNPFLRLFPGLVERKQTGLATPLDQLVWLCNELGVEDPARELGVRCDGVGLGVPGDLCNPRCRIDEFRLHGRRRVDGRGTLEPVGEQKLRVVLADGCAGERERSERDARRTRRETDGGGIALTFGGHFARNGE